jgi:hypothetical protein
MTWFCGSFASYAGAEVSGRMVLLPASLREAVHLKLPYPFYGLYSVGENPGTSYPQHETVLSYKPVGVYQRP